MSSAKVYLVTGASRGIGLEFVNQLLRRSDANTRVIAGARNPSSASALQSYAKEFGNRLTLITLDVGDEASVNAAAKDIGAKFPEGITHLINNAGIAGSTGSATDLTKADLVDICNTNVAGPLIVTKAFLPLLIKSSASTKYVFTISSQLGSISCMTKDWSFKAGYNVSKSAVNMLMVNFACDPALDGKNIAFFPLHPGWVDTDMGSAGGRKPPVQVNDCVSGLLKVMDSSKLSESGKFSDWEGKVVPW